MSQANEFFFYSGVFFFFVRHFDASARGVAIDLSHAHTHISTYLRSKHNDLWQLYRIRADRIKNIL